MPETQVMPRAHEYVMFSDGISPNDLGKALDEALSHALAAGAFTAITSIRVATHDGLYVRRLKDGRLSMSLMIDGTVDLDRG